MKSLSATIATAALLALASPASAAVSFIVSPIGVQGTGAGFEPPVPTGILTTPYVEFGITFDNATGQVQVMNNTTGEGAFPHGDTSLQYLSVLGSASIDASFGALKDRVSFYWGSVDTYNTVQFYNGAALVNTFTGTGVIPTLAATGNQTDFGSNRHVTLLSDVVFDRVVFSSGQNSFEIDNISAGVPETSTWAMMLLGFAGLAFATYRRSRRALPIAA
jgi:hypothetical protein